MEQKPTTHTNKTEVTYISIDGDIVTTVLLNATWNDITKTITGTDPDTGLTVSLNNIQYYHAL